MFWIITPLQNAVVSTSTITRNITIDISLPLDFGPSSIHSSLLSAKFAFDVYNYAWLNQSLNPYMTEDVYIMHPTEYGSAEISSGNNYTMTFPTVAFGSDIICKKALGPDTPSPTLDFYINSNNYTNGAGCYFVAGKVKTDNGNARFIYAGPVPLNRTIDGIFDVSSLSSETAFYLTGNCSSPTGGVFAGLVALNGNESTAPVSFCQASYTQQQVLATVSSAGDIISMQNTSEPEALSGDLFDSLIYEQIISSGRALALQGFPQYAFPSQSQKQLATSLTPINVFLLGLAGGNVSNINSALELQNVARKAHKLLFAAALSNLQNLTQPNNSKVVTGIQEIEQVAVVIEQPLAIILEVCLGICFGLSVFLMIYNWNRYSPIWSDPASFSSLASLVSESPALWQHLIGNQIHSDTEVCSKILLQDDVRYRIGGWHDGDFHRLDVLSLGSETCDLSAASMQKPGEPTIYQSMMTLI
jgi:hypothetical protein